MGMAVDFKLAHPAMNEIRHHALDFAIRNRFAVGRSECGTISIITLK